MRLYKVENFVYELSNSLLPPRDPEPAEKKIVQEAMISPTGKQLVELLIRLGYTHYQAQHMYDALVTHYAYDFGMRDLIRINENIKFWIQAHVAPAWRQVREPPPAGLPPAVVTAVAVIAILALVVLLVAPEFQQFYKWQPPCDLYLATYEENLWWMTLVHRDRKRRLWYRALGFEGGVITAHTYEYIAPPVVTDRLHFWGTMDFRCWQIPWFRSYRAQHADCTFIGFLEHVYGDFYIIRPPFDDPFAPPGEFELSPDQYCTAFSPCHA